MREFLDTKKGIVVIPLLVMIFSFFLDLGIKSYAQMKNAEKVEEEETYTRPAPVRPIRPEIPNANRFRQDKIFLEYADSLYKIDNHDTIEKQILKGNVKFRQAGMWMYCDSAYYYPDNNSLDAFGNVKMEQGDTLFVFADKLYYDGNTKLARLQNGPSREKVRLINNEVTLTSDSIDYDLDADLGWYSRWGTLDDKVNTLTSLFGEYSPSTKEADFFKDVVLVNKRDGYTLLTDTLHYNTQTHIATTESPTEIQSENDTILTRRAIYNSETGNADLLTRSTIMHRDSTGKVITLEGDSIIYDKSAHISRAYMFRNPAKKPFPMIITDTARKISMIGGFGIFNDSTQEAGATIYPLLMEYSQGDTLFMRADTIKIFVVQEWIEEKIANKNREVNHDYVKIDSLKIYPDLKFFSVEWPALKAEGPDIENYRDTENYRDKIIEDIEIDYLANMPPDSVPISANTDIIDNLSDETVLRETPEAVDIYENMENPPSDNQDLPAILNNPERLEIEEADSLSNTIKRKKDFHIAVAYNHGRFFKQDMQGIADTMVFVEKDSMLYLFQKPVVWSGERQVTGNRIEVHFNDSTADWALLPESGLISEHVDEDFYNQITGKSIRATFADNTMDFMEVSGNVETIFLPQESDSTFNRLVNAESSFLELHLKDNKMDRLKMWPEVNGTVTPLFLVKKSQQYLRDFRWLVYLRPVREWYGNRIRWMDDLGEVSSELDSYFNEPSVFGEPKKRMADIIELPETSLPDWNINLRSELQFEELKDETIEEIEEEWEENEADQKEAINDLESQIEKNEEIPDLEEDIQTYNPEENKELNSKDFREDSETIIKERSADE